MAEDSKSNPTSENLEEISPLESEEIETDQASSLTIQGIDEPAILHYFSALNSEDFEAVGSLFIESGELHAPFEDPIVGPAAITAYLQAEARGIKAMPREGEPIPRQDHYQEFQITGRVKTSLFSVKVAWFFVLTPQKELAAVAIKLLASMQDLAKLRDKMNLKDDEQGDV